MGDYAAAYDVPERSSEIPVGEHSFRAWPGKPGAGTIPLEPLEGPTLQEQLTAEYQRGVRAQADYDRRQREELDHLWTLRLKAKTSEAYHRGWTDGHEMGFMRCFERSLCAAIAVVGTAVILALAGYSL